MKMKTRIFSSLGLTFLLLVRLELAGQVPSMITYQGQVLASGTNFHGPGQFKFALVNSNASVTFWSNNGTSVNGGEPTAAVTLPVQGGLFSVALGNTEFANMSALPTAVFVNADVRLRIWFSGGGDFELLSPDQRLTAVGYSLMAANVPDALITASKLANGAVTSGRIANNAVTSAKLADYAVTGAKLATGAVTGVQLAATNSLGASSGPAGRLDIYRTTSNTPSITLNGAESRISTFGANGLERMRLGNVAYGELWLSDALNNTRTVTLTAGDEAGSPPFVSPFPPGLTLSSAQGLRRAELSAGAAGGALALVRGTPFLVSGPTTNGILLDAQSLATGGPLLTVHQNSGSVGVRLDGNGAAISTFGSDAREQIRLWGLSYGEMLLFDSSTSNRQAVLLSANNAGGGLLRLNRANSTDAGVNMWGGQLGGELQLFNRNDALGFNVRGQNDAGEAAAWGGFYDNGAERITFAARNGSSGRGGLIDIKNNNGRNTLRLQGDSGTGQGDLRMYNAAGTETVHILAAGGTQNGGAIQLRNGTGQTTLGIYANSNGQSRVVTQVMEITGGSDFSEQFDVTPIDDEVRPGMLVCIDPQNPGRLRPSRGAYDRTVAGVVSGAGGVKPGMLMRQAGSVADGQHPVALSGRVYCLADARAGSIQPGDLLTTSDLPGHGMKVSDFQQAQGAVIGKAMSSLAEGTGLVLVLVSLQ